MCGKFSAMMRWDEYCELAGVDPSDGGGGDDAPKIDPKSILGLFTPMSKVPVLHLGPVRQRRLTMMRWGWPDDRGQRPFAHLHARSETIDTTMAWTEPFYHGQRGVIFAKEFNIGEELPNGKIQQWVCRRKDLLPVVIPVLYTFREWVPQNLWAFVMVTQDSVPPLNGRDNRMPALLEMDDIPQWICEQSSTKDELKAMLLKPYSAELEMRQQAPGKPTAQRNTTRAKPKPQKPAEPTLF